MRAMKFYKKWWGRWWHTAQVEPHQYFYRYAGPVTVGRMRRLERRLGWMVESDHDHA